MFADQEAAVALVNGGSVEHNWTVLEAGTTIGSESEFEESMVLDIGSEYLFIVAPSMLVMAVGIVLGRGFDGAGNTVPAMVINLITLWGVEVGLAFVLSRWVGMGATGVWWGRAASGLANGLLFAFWFKRGKWKLKVK